VVTIGSQELLQQFEVHLSDSALAPATVVNYLADLRAFLRWSEESKGAEISPMDLESQDIESFCSYLRATKGQAPSTVNRRLQALRKFYSFAMAQGWTDQNPAEAVALLSETVSVRSRFLTLSDISRLLDAVKAGNPRWADRDWAIMQVFLRAGLKLSELTGLCLSDVELEGDAPCLRVRGTPREGDRRIPVDAELRSALVSYLPTRRAAPGVDRFFVNRDGNPLSTRSVQRLLHHYAQAAEVDGLTTQALRYEYARKIAENNDDLSSIARLLGHRHIATTIRYLRPMPPPSVPDAQ
jgi:site-specific recombinase XerD